MPTYEFECKKCHLRYDDNVPYDETGKYKKVKCPGCKSRSKIKLVSSCTFQFGNPVGTDRWNSDSGGHDYRFQHKQPQVRKEREQAQQASHMGTTPYNPIDDVSGGNYFGQVK